MAGIYIHIPFCKSRCAYCDFYSQVNGALMDDCVDLICKELQLRTTYLSSCGDAYQVLDTLYFGGGTPSLLKERHWQQLFKTLFACYSFSKDAEITLEANPDDLTSCYVKVLARLPFNRISIGIQSLQEQELNYINRRHTAEEAEAAVRRCQANGFENISIDLMYGLPKQTLLSWEKTIDRVLTWQVPHISSYHLSYEKGTVLYKQLVNGEIQEATEQESLAYAQLLVDRLKAAGYEHYEISNFAFPNRYSKHNSSYWKEIPYLGIGPSAHSYNLVSRQWNFASITQWMTALKEGSQYYEKEALDLQTRYNDYVITALRTMWGIDLEKVEQGFGEYLNNCKVAAQKYLEEGMLREEQNHLILTEEGVLISNQIMRDLIVVEGD